MSKNKTFTPTNEFQVGKHSIGWLGSYFEEKFISPNIQFEERPLGSYQTLTKYMKDAEIENDLKPGICELGDVLAFLKNPPEGTKDGNWNLFYTASCVVRVSWDSDAGGWSVRAWNRGGSGWGAGVRVFSPATRALEPKASELSDTLALEDAIKLVKKKGYLIYQPI